MAGHYDFGGGVADVDAGDDRHASARQPAPSVDCGSLTHQPSRKGQIARLKRVRERHEPGLRGAV